MLYLQFGGIDGHLNALQILLEYSQSSKIHDRKRMTASNTLTSLDSMIQVFVTVMYMNLEIPVAVNINIRFFDYLHEIRSMIHKMELSNLPYRSKYH